MEELRLALVQIPLLWENAKANREHIETLLNKGEIKSDLTILPEMFTTGFTMNPAPVAEIMPGETLEWMRNMARALDSAICGSVIIEENGRYFNRFLFVRPDGNYSHYDKRHLFTLAGEDNKYSAGRDRLIVDYMGWRICPLICYDLRFPVFARNDEDYDLLLFVANWPTPRVDAWSTLLLARAIENQTYVAGVNRVGEDENGMQYSGQSTIIDPAGNYIIEPDDETGIKVASVCMKPYQEFRNKYPFYQDRDKFKIL